MSDNDSNVHEELTKIRGRLRSLTVAVVLMMLLVVLSFLGQIAELANWFAGDPQLLAAATIGSALLGFGFGWFARRRV